MELAKRRAVKSPNPRLLDQSPWNFASQGRSCRNFIFLVGNCAVTRGPIRGLYEINTRSAHVAEPELTLGLGYVCPDCRSSFDRVLSVVEMHTDSHRLRLAAVWLRAALWGGGMHLVFYLRLSQSASSVVCVTRVPCCGVVLAVRRVVRCMLGLCLCMVWFFSGNGFGIMFSLVASWTCLLPAILVPVNTLSRMLGVFGVLAASHGPSRHDADLDCFC